MIKIFKRLLQRPAKYLDLAYFYMTGKKPWTRGYDVYKWRYIQQALANHVEPDRLPANYGFRIDDRVVEYLWFLEKLPAGEGRLLDAGSVLNHAPIINHTKLANKKLWISTLAPESRAFWQKGISYVYEDLRHSCLKDDYFDWICCLSTLEHVGLDNTYLYTSDTSKNENVKDGYLDAITELKRLLKPGGCLYLSVPYGDYFNHGWFQVFDSGMIQKLLDQFAPSKSVISCYQYRPDGWANAGKNDIEHARYFDIHASKKYDPDYAAASRGLITLELFR